INLVVQVVKIDGLGLPRLSRSPRQGPAVHQRVDQGGFPHIGFPGKSHLRQLVLGKCAGYPADRLERNLLDLHSFSSLPRKKTTLPAGLPRERMAAFSTL